jgi:repressor LexA
MPRKTDTRQRVLDFIIAFKEQYGCAPTLREIAQGCAISTWSVVQHHLKKLAEEGTIARVGAGKYRAISVIQETVTIPMLGRIAAGRPIPVLSQETLSTAERIPLSLPIKHPERLYALKVQGSSMIDALIADGDIVIMEPADGVKNGDIVAAYLQNEEEATLKRIYFEGERVRLQPCNPYMLPIYTSTENVLVQGRVVGVMRTCA